ncbi:MAG TPA: hypothetical protein VJ301_18810, partial [Propionibacteriaceae bacterium]|nr:hypothetical protein [Propionibacteriaceae bacterium]
MRFRRIDPRIWHDDKFPRLTRDGRLLFFHLLTSPRSNALGCYVQGRADMAEYCGFSAIGITKALGELMDLGLVQYHSTLRLVFLPHFFRYNPIQNENQAKFAASQVTELPPEPTSLEILLGGLDGSKPFLEPLRQALAERLRQAHSNGMPFSEKEKYLEKYPEKYSPPVVPPEGDFDRFWKQYPKKVGKGAALRAWQTHARSTPLETILSALAAQAGWLGRDGGKFIPNPATWLNQRRWEDQPPDPGRPGD